jgi:hypothetical protein
VEFHDDAAQTLKLWVPFVSATVVSSTLEETRTYFGGLMETPRIPLPGASGVDAA